MHTVKMVGMALPLICVVSAHEVTENFFELVVGLPHQKTELLDELFWNISTPGTLLLFSLMLSHLLLCCG